MTDRSTAKKFWIGLISSILLVGNTTPLVLAQANITATPRSSKANAESLNVYLLGPGDLLQVAVIGYEEFPGTPQAILPDGSITLPLIGRYQAVNKTLEQVQRELKQSLSQYLVDPRIEVTLAGLRPIIVTVSGAVRRPGPLQLESVPLSTTNTSGVQESSRPRLTPTLSQAIAAAGGVTREANIRDVTLNRVTSSGISQTISINLWDAIQSNQVTQDITLRDGDSIYIPKAVNLDTDAQALLARSAYGAQSVKVKVIGEVKAPGEVEIPPYSTVASAIANAGGPTDKANMGRVRFFRLNPNGQVEEKILSLNSLTESTQIDDGDVIVVPKGDGYRFIDGFRDIISPLGAASFFLNLFR